MKIFFIQHFFYETWRGRALASLAPSLSSPLIISISERFSLRAGGLPSYNSVDFRPNNKINLFRGSSPKSALVVERCFWLTLIFMAFRTFILHVGSRSSFKCLYLSFDHDPNCVLTYNNLWEGCHARLFFFYVCNKIICTASFVPLFI